MSNDTSSAEYEIHMRDAVRLDARYEVWIMGCGSACETREDVDADIAANAECLGNEGESNFVLDHETRKLYWL